jgi:glycosyltransferase involved in cell wall biosynthesis
MRIAIVHDFLNQFGGAERVISALHEIWPEAPIYTSIYDQRRLPDVFRQMDIKVSFMQQLPFIFALYKYYFWLYPLAFEKFDLSEYDIILSSSSAYAKGVKKQPNQVHLCYCYTPMRFVWRFEDYLLREKVPGFLKKILLYLLEPIKQWDLQNSKTVNRFIAISRIIAKRIKQTYGRESDIIYPPVETKLFQQSTTDMDYFLVVSRLNAYKRIDLVVKAFNHLDIPLKIIGDGPVKADLQRLAGPNTEFLGRLPDQQIRHYLAECRALIFPGEEDFGIVPVEAMSCGRPVIAFKAGGALETVIEGETGLFFNEPTADSLIKAIRRFQFMNFNKQKIRDHALGFDKEIFKRQIKDLVEQAYGQRKNN